MADALIANFTKRFTGAHITADLRQKSGQLITVLFGPSGCGKTTILRCLAGLEKPDEGTIEFSGRTWFDARNHLNLPPQERGIGLVFQDYALFPHLTVEENISFGLRGLSTPDRQRRIQELLERFELCGNESKRPRELSGGQQQRVALARALACSPKLLLLDEPLSALDAGLREQLRAELRRWLTACGIPVLLVTHDRDEALALGDELVVMSAGKPLQSGPVLEVFNRPANAEAARIVRMENVQPGRVLSTTESIATVEIGTARIMAITPDDIVGDVLVCIRGEDVMLQSNPSPTTSARNLLPARIVAIQPGSPLTRVELDAGFPLFALVTRLACDEMGLRPGLPVSALVKATAVHLAPR